MFPTKTFGPKFYCCKFKWSLQRENFIDYQLQTKQIFYWEASPLLVNNTCLTLAQPALCSRKLWVFSLNFKKAKYHNIFLKIVGFHLLHDWISSIFPSSMVSSYFFKNNKATMCSKKMDNATLYCWKEHRNEIHIVRAIYFQEAHFINNLPVVHYSWCCWHIKH